jgi:hypothetical protein
MDAEELTTLASTAATTVVKLLATTAWEQAKHAVTELWRRKHPERVETVQAELEDSRAELVKARQAADEHEQVEQDLVIEWNGRLRRLAADDPATVDELRHLVARLTSALSQAEPEQTGTITMQATTFGSSRVNQAGRDLHVH